MTASVDLRGQVAIITGAARGQGRSHAVALAALGVDIVACDLPAGMGSIGYPLATPADLDETVKRVEAEGVRCLGVQTDVRDASAVAAAVERALTELGRIDILLANAGVVTMSPLCDVTDEAWDEMVGTNLTGVFNCVRAVLPSMRERQYGRIVVTSSMGGRMGVPNLAAYNATKWGVIGLAKSVALEVAKQGITVNVVCPTTVDTPMVTSESNPFGVEMLERFKRANPIPQPWLQAEDVTRAILHLVTDPGVMTGSVLEIGLGSSARLN